MCGAVRYSLKARPLAVNACHCNACKKLTGATNLLMILAMRESFEHAGEIQKYRRRADSGREIDIVRCATCGVRMWHEPLAGPQFVFVAVGTLDDPTWAMPTSHIWTEVASPGVSFHDDAIIIQGQPSDRQILIDAFNRVYPTLP
jgi:hypothetical protein